MTAPLFARQLAGCLLGGFAATAMASPAHDEDPFFEPLPVVLTASRLPQPLRDTPGAVSVIDAELIAATGYRDLARVFRLVPGMQVAQERGNDQWVAYHGLGADYPNQMQILVDGRSVYSPFQFGGTDWGALALSTEDIDRIEVVRGTDSAAYGSNAFLGVINILTRHTATEPASSVTLNLGTHGTADAIARVVTHHGHLGLRITAQHQQDDGIARLKDGRRIDSINLRADLQLSEIDELTLTAGHNQGRREQGFKDTLFDVSAQRPATHHHSNLHLRWRHSPSPDEEWSLSWYQNRERAREEWQVNSGANLQRTLGTNHPIVAALLAVPPIVAEIDINRASRRDNVELQHRLRRSETLRLLWGAEWRIDQLESASLFNDTRARAQREWRLFGNTEWRMAPQWLWNAGAMVEKIEHDRARVAPRLFLNWQPQPAATFRIGYSGGWRQPALFERTADQRIVHPALGELQITQQGNRALKPQHIDTYELGFLGVLARGAGSIDIRLFDERIKDFIVRRTGQFSPANALHTLGLPNDIFQQFFGGTRWVNAHGMVRLSGLEYQLRVHPWSGGQFMLNHSMIRARSKDPAVNRSVAPYMASLSWLQEMGRWRSTLSLLRIGPSEAANGFVPNTPLTADAYTTLDWSMARTLRLGSQALELRFSGINLLGKHQELVHRPVELLPEFRGSKAANPMEPQLHVSLRTQF